MEGKGPVGSVGGSCTERTTAAHGRRLLPRRRPLTQEAPRASPGQGQGPPQGLEGPREAYRKGEEDIDAVIETQNARLQELVEKMRNIEKETQAPWVLRDLTPFGGLKARSAHPRFWGT